MKLNNSAKIFLQPFKCPQVHFASYEYKTSQQVRMHNSYGIGIYIVDHQTQ